MKIFIKALLLLMAVVVGPTYLSAQLTWAPLSAEWTYSAFDLNGSHFPFNVAVSEEYLRGDSLIRVVLPELNTGFGQAANVHLPTTVYGEGDKLFREINGQWHLLYDFTLNVGDTMKLLVDPVNRSRNEIDSFAYFSVDSIGIIDINGFTLKTQFLRLFEIAQADAGLGFTGWRYQFIGTVTGYFKDRREIGCEDKCPELLRCYSDNVLGNVNFVDFPCDTTVLVSTNAPPDYSQELILSPNPATEGVTIELSWDGQSPITDPRLEVTDARARRITVSYQSSGTRYEINTAGLPAGLYQVSLTGREGRAVKRVLIQ